MRIKDAFTRAVRTAAATFVAAVVLVRPAADVVGLRQAAIGQATSFAFAALFGVSAGVVTFVTCFAEDNTQFQLPK